MGHNAIVRVSAFMECCNLPVAERKGRFPAGKMISHDYYEGCLLLGGGYDAWILPHIISFDEQLHNIITFFTRERRWLVGAQTWFRFCMSKSLSNFGKINMLQRAIFYYAAVIGLFTFILSFYGLHYTFSHPLRTHIALRYMKHHLEMGYMKYVALAGIVLLLPATIQMTIYYFTFHKEKKIQKMGGHIKFIFSYFFFSFVQSNIILIAMCLLDKFLWDWFRKKDLLWAEQDRDGTLLSWKACITNLYPISILGIGLITYSFLYIFPYITPISLALLLHVHMHFIGILFIKIGIIYAPSVLAGAPIIARLTSRTFPYIQKKKWLLTPYDRENLYPVVKQTYAYTNALKKAEFNSFSFEDGIKDLWFAVRHMATLPSRPRKFAFWKDKLKDKELHQCTRLEKLTIFRCRELWDMFFLRERNGKNSIK